MTNNKLTDERVRLREAAKNYQIALAWYQSNIDSPAALQTWDTATAEFMRVIAHRETDIIADLLAEIEELQEYRKAASKPVAWLLKPNVVSCSESVARQHSGVPLYAAPQPLTDAERAELQEYRKAAEMKVDDSQK